MMFVLLYTVIANVVFVQYSVFGIWVSGLLLVVSGICVFSHLCMLESGQALYV